VLGGRQRVKNPVASQQKWPSPQFPGGAFSHRSERFI
jgi:hypothetical protein